MQTEPFLNHLLLGFTASKEASLNSAPNLDRSGFDAHLGLEAALPDASREEGSPLPSADPPVAWSGALWPAVPAACFPAWPAERPSDGAAPIDAKPVEIPPDAGFAGWVSPAPSHASGVGEKVSPPGEGSITPIPDGTIRKLATLGDDQRAVLTSFPQRDASEGYSLPSEGGPHAGGSPGERASLKSSPPTAEEPIPFGLPDRANAEAGPSLDSSMPNGSASDPKTGTSPGSAGMYPVTAPRPAPPTGAVGEAKNPRTSAGAAPDKVPVVIADPKHVPDDPLPFPSNITDKPGQPPASFRNRTEAPLPSAGQTREVAILLGELGADPQPGPAERGSHLSQPAIEHAAPTAPVPVSGRERLWLGDQHMLAGPAGESSNRTSEIGLSVKAAPEAVAAKPDREVSLLLSPGTGAAIAPWMASGLADPDFQPIEDHLFSAEPAVGFADRMPLPPIVAASPLLPAASVLQAAAQIAASLVQRGDGTTEIALSPEELGSVRLQFQSDAQNPDRLVVHLAFDRRETMDLFRRHADQLTEAIRSAGYSEARLDFGQAGAGSGEGERPGQASRPDTGLDTPQTSAGQQAATTAEPDRPYALRLSGVAGMDLRL